MTYPFVRLGLVDVVNIDEHDSEASDILETYPIDFSWKIGYKTCAMCIFENMTYPLVGLSLIDVVDVDEHDLEASDISETISFFLEK